MTRLALVPLAETPDLHVVTSLELRRLLATARFRAQDPIREQEERDTYFALEGLYRGELQLRGSAGAEPMRDAHEELLRVISSPSS